MKKFKILTSLLFALCLLLPMSQSAFAADDLTGTYYENDMRALISKGLLSGYPDGTYRPDQDVTRAEFAAFVVRALDYYNTSTSTQTPTSPVTINFTDVPQGSQWYNTIQKAVSIGFVSGYADNTFRPSNKISRQEMASMIDRALAKENIQSDLATINFKDKDKINIKVFGQAIQRLLFLGVIADGDYFRPLDPITRGETSAIINRVLGVLNAPPPVLDFKVANVSSSGTTVVGQYGSFDDAKSHVTTGQVILEGGKIAWMKDGYAYTSAFTTFGDTYIPTGTEVKYIGSDANTVQVEIAGNQGTVNQSNVTLVPTPMITGQSYYDVSGNTLTHHIYNPISKTYASYQYGYAPDAMVAGTKYYSWDGHTFYSNSSMTGTPIVAYQYFDLLPLNTATTYTADELNQYVVNNIPDSIKTNSFGGGAGPLATLGASFINAQNQYGVNAMYLLAHAILESNWGSSRIAHDKFNLYGYGATDSDPYANAKTFTSYDDCVMFIAQTVAETYQTPGNWRYFGSMLGNKNSGMNMKYASDPFWGQKIASYMYRIDQYLGSKDFNKYQLAVVVTEDGLNVRTQPYTTSGSSVLYSYPVNHAGEGMILDGTVNNSEGNWFKVWSDQSDFRAPQDVYVYNNGTYGLLTEQAAIAK
jgi:beta-N-acetylglucosaminidase